MALPFSFSEQLTIAQNIEKVLVQLPLGKGCRSANGEFCVGLVETQSPS